LLYLCCMKLDKLRTIKNFADMNKVTAVYIYKLIKEGKLHKVVIDGVQFIDTVKYPTIHN